MQIWAAKFKNRIFDCQAHLPRLLIWADSLEVMSSGTIVYVRNPLVLKSVSIVSMRKVGQSRM